MVRMGRSFNFFMLSLYILGIEIFRTGTIADSVLLFAL